MHKTLEQRLAFDFTNMPSNLQIQHDLYLFLKL